MTEPARPHSKQPVTLMSADPQAAVERRTAARHLVQRPLTCAEQDPEVFRLIRRHSGELDRWFAQRLGYRLHVDADTARLFKAGAVVSHRPLRTSGGRPFHHVEYLLLALVLATTAAGPAIVSLRDLIDDMRSAAAEVAVILSGDATERRALVTVLRWMIDHGLASELHAHVEAYASDDTADAVLKLRPDRIVLLPLPALVSADDAAALFERSDRRSASRQWMRAQLVEQPVLYRHDLTDEEWGELRRRLGEEERLLDEMFGLVVEARAEGIATIDPAGTLAEQRFPLGGTLGHAALLVIDELHRRGPTAATEVTEICGELASARAKNWSNDYVAAPHRLARDVIELLVELRLAVKTFGDTPAVELLPAATRFAVVESDPELADAAQAPATLW